jgi:hypothetical protein
METPSNEKPSAETQAQDKAYSPIETKAAGTNLPAASGAGVETKTTTAAALVAEDHDKFPPSRDEDQDDDDGGENDAEQRPKNPGGRPKGKKDSYPRGRPNRADWANKPMGKKKPKSEGFTPYDDDLPDPNAEPEPARPQAESPRPVDYRALASFACDMTAGGLSSFFGPHWNYAKSPAPGMPDEREMMIAHLAAYLEANQIQDIPPGMMLAISVVGYAAPRIFLTIKMKKAQQPRQVNPMPAAKTAANPTAAATPPTAAPSGRPGEGQAPRDFGPADENETQ